MAQNDFSPDAWTRARNRFVEDLTDEEQVCRCSKQSATVQLKFQKLEILSEKSSFWSRASSSFPGRKP